MSKLIAFCAGHGADTYPPNKGVPGLPEHEFNAAVVGYAASLAEFNGFRSLLVQPLNGKERALAERTYEAKAKGADLYFSVHADANTDPGAWGFWSFYWGDSSEGKRLAETWYGIASKHLPNYNPARRPTAGSVGHWANFHVTRVNHQNGIPAILVEHGFMTNPNDLILLKSDGFRRKCAEVAVRAICAYFGKPFKLPQAKATSSEDRKTGEVTVERFRDTTVHSLFLRKGTFKAKIVERKGATVSQLVKEHGADFGVNFPYHYEGKLLGNVVEDGKLTRKAYGKMLKWHSVGFSEDGVRIGMLDPSDGYGTLIQGAPLLIEGGKQCYEFYRKYQEVNDDIGMGRYHDPVKYRIQPQRTFFTLDKQGNLIVSVSDGRTDGREMGLDLQDMADYAERFDPVWSINGDGGGSSVLVEKGGKVLTRLQPSERQNNHALLFYVDKPKEDEPLPKVTRRSATEVVITDDDGNILETRREDALLVSMPSGETVTYLPLRKLAESVGGKVGWNQEKMESSLTIKKR